MEEKKYLKWYNKLTRNVFQTRHRKSPVFTGQSGKYFF